MSTSNPNIRLDKRDLILTKGSEVMIRRGYHGTGVQEIVQAAGIPKGSFYHYFASKEDFAVHALEHIYGPRLQRYAQALSNPALSPSLRIVSFYRDLLSHFSRQEKPQYHCLIGSLSFEMAEPSQPIGEQVESILQRSVDILAQCLTEAREAGELSVNTDCVELAEFIANAWEGTLMRMKAGANAAPLGVFVHQLERLLTPV